MLLLLEVTIYSSSGIPKTEAMNWRLFCCIAHIRSGKGCKGSLNFLMICPYMVKKTLYQIELNLLKAFFLFEILFSYSETLSENGSHELTGALHILGPTLEAMNWRHCIPRVGVHYIESTLCPTVADWSLSDRGRLEPVRPWSIGQHGHAIFHRDDSHCQCFTWHGSCRFLPCSSFTK